MPDFISETLHLNAEFVNGISNLVSENPDFYILYIFIYLLPSFIAYAQKKHNQRSIFIYNVIFGFTGVSWFVMLIWAMVEPEKKPDKPPIAKECPHCKELIKFLATVCHHCHTSLEPQKPPSSNDGKPGVSK